MWQCQFLESERPIAVAAQTLAETLVPATVLGLLSAAVAEAKLRASNALATLAQTRPPLGSAPC